MPHADRYRRGFTLIELMVTLTVLVILSLLAVPSLNSFRQRSALRGASEQALGFWNQARFEAAKRNSMVKVGVFAGGGGYCLGAATTTDPADDEPCDCTTAGACDVAVFPGEQKQWEGVTLASTTLGSDSGVAVIEPKRTGLTDSAQAGVISLLSPPGNESYRVNLRVDELGRGVLCESTSAANSMSDYTNRRCAP
jgi:type IV fimbrial biogenesis protein FimT